MYRHEVDEQAKTLKLWVRRKPVHRGFECSGCGRRLHQVHDVREREIRDLPWSVYRATVVVEVHRLRCPECGVRVEKIEQLPSKAPFSKRFEEIVGEACESAAASQVARRFHLPEATVRAIDMRYLERWDQRRRKPALKQMGVDEIYRGKNDKFLTVVSNLETGEPLWFGKERKQETLDEYFKTQLRSGQRKRIEAACVDMWEPFRLSIAEWAPACRIVYDKFHIIQHANDAVDEVRRAEFFRKGRKMRDVIKGKKWLLLEPLEEPGQEPTRRSEPGVPSESASVQSLPAQRKSGTALGLPLRGRHAELPAEVDRSTTMAALALLSEARGHAAQTPRRDSELLPDQGSLRGRRSYHRQHPYVDQPRARL